MVWNSLDLFQLRCLPPVYPLHPLLCSIFLFTAALLSRLWTLTSNKVCQRFALVTSTLTPNEQICWDTAACRPFKMSVQVRRFCQETILSVAFVYDTHTQPDHCQSRSKLKEKNKPCHITSLFNQFMWPSKSMMQVRDGSLFLCFSSELLEPELWCWRESLYRQTSDSTKAAGPSSDWSRWHRGLWQETWTALLAVKGR